MSDSKKKKLWIGLVNIIPNNGNNELEGAQGAYTNVIVNAVSKNDFLIIIEKKFSSLQYEVVDVDDPETFEQRANKYHLRDELWQLAEKAKKSDEFVMDRLHRYEHDDESI